MTAISDKIVLLIKNCINKGLDLEFSECPDFNDGVTFNIFIRDNNGKYIFESERVTTSDIYFETELNKILKFVVSQKR